MKTKGFIFLCSDITEQECFDRSLFGGGEKYTKRVKGLEKDDVLFLYNYNTKKFHGVFKAITELDAWWCSVQKLGIKQSMSAPGCPWENGYQESFYKGFKLDLSDPNRFDTLGELVAAIYQTINYYNQNRIHSALNVPPRLFKEQHEVSYKDLEKVS